MGSRNGKYNRSVNTLGSRAAKGEVDDLELRARTMIRLLRDEADAAHTSGRWVVEKRTPTGFRINADGETIAVFVHKGDADHVAMTAPDFALAVVEVLENLVVERVARRIETPHP